METKKITKTYSWGKIEYGLNNLGQKHGLYRFWHPNGKIDFIDTNKKSRDFGTAVQFYH
jgi:hypothetical protein